MGRSRPQGRRNKRNHLRRTSKGPAPRRHNLQPPERPLFEPVEELELPPEWQGLLGICTPPDVTPPPHRFIPKPSPSPPPLPPPTPAPEISGTTGTRPSFPPRALIAPPPAYSRPGRAPIFLRAADPRLRLVDHFKLPYQIVADPPSAHLEWLFGETSAPEPETPAAARTSARDPRLRQ